MTAQKLKGKKVKKVYCHFTLCTIKLQRQNGWLENSYKHGLIAAGLTGLTRKGRGKKRRRDAKAEVEDLRGGEGG